MYRHPGGNPGADLKSISHRCHPIMVAFVWELTKETVDLPLGCLQGGTCVDERGERLRRELHKRRERDHQELLVHPLSH